MNDIQIRCAEPEDYDPIIIVLDDWFDGRPVSRMLHRLFFIHFRETSFVVEDEGKLIGFLVGFLSQTFPDEAYIHFVGVDPEHRNAGLGRKLYKHFFDVALKNGRNTVRCITSPINKSSISFHLHMGFEIEPQQTKTDGIPVYRNYDGHGIERVLLVKRLMPHNHHLL